MRLIIRSFVAAVINLAYLKNKARSNYYRNLSEIISLPVYMTLAVFNPAMKYVLLKDVDGKNIYNYLREKVFDPVDHNTQEKGRTQKLSKIG